MSIHNNNQDSDSRNARATRQLQPSDELRRVLDHLLSTPPPSRPPVRRMPSQDPPFEIPWSRAGGPAAVLVAAGVICLIGWILVSELEPFLRSFGPGMVAPADLWSEQA